MSETPHIKAYLCDECWNKLPHYKVDNLKNKPKQTIKKGYTWGEIVLYTLGNLACLVVIGYYIWLK